MKLKTSYLFLIIILLFACSFYVVNLKFDKFYRVNGINNDNRVLIEKYLDQNEQEFLIDNQISIDLFLEYIEKDEFHLKNYQYYNLLKLSNRYKNKDEILKVGNSLATRLEYLFQGQAVVQAQNLVEHSLEMAFLNEEKFQFDYMSLYSELKKLYKNDDYTYINDTEDYVQRLNKLGYVDKKDLESIFRMMTKAYNKESLSTFLYKDNVELVFNPYELSTVVNDKKYIGDYEPADLLLLQDIPRVRYTMYLQKDAYNALVNMYHDLSQLYDCFLVRDAYISAQTLDLKRIGFEEQQLGLTIDITQSETPYQDFSKTDMSHWLEEHAYEYGYILRYPRDKASITNHKYDAHIYRYVGKSLAKSLHDSQLTLEEYVKTNE